MTPHPMAQAILRADFGSGNYEIDGLCRVNFFNVHARKGGTELKTSGIRQEM